MRRARKLLSRGGRVVLCAYLIACMVWSVPMVRGIQPDSAKVTDNANVTGVPGDVLVQVLGDNAVIDWDNMDVYTGQSLEFMRAGDQAFAVLNRVAMIEGALAKFTYIDGNLIGNQGQIIIVNPYGVAFGPHALVNAYQFTASSLDLTNFGDDADQIFEAVPGIEPLVGEYLQVEQIDGYGFAVCEAFAVECDI